MCIRDSKYDPPRAITLEYVAPTFIDLTQMLAAIDGAHAKLGIPVQAQLKPNCGSGNKMVHVDGADQLFGPPDIQRLSSALAVQDPDCDEREWKFGVIGPLARAARDYPEIADGLEQLAISFSSGELRGKPSRSWTTPGKSNGLTGEQVFDSVWERFLNEPPSDDTRTSLGTIFHNAENAGWVRSSSVFAAMEPIEVAPVQLSLIHI